MAGDNNDGNPVPEGKWGPYATKKDMVEAETLHKHITGLIRTLKTSCDGTSNQVSVAKELKTDLHVARMLKSFDKCETTMELINEAAAQLLMLAEPPESEIMKQCNSWVSTYTQLAQEVAEAEVEVGKAKANANAQPPAPPAAPTAGGGPRVPGMPKANDLLRPKELQADDKPSVLRLWKREFQDYYESNRMDLLTRRVAQNLFLQCISQKLRIKVRQRISDATPVLPAPAASGAQNLGSCYQALDDIFKAAYPIVRRRQEFFCYMQKPNQKTSDYMDKVKELFDEAEFHTFKPGELLTYKTIQGCTVEPARTKFVREEAPDFEKLAKIAQTIEAGENALKGQPRDPAHNSQGDVHADQVGGAGKFSQNVCRRCNGRDASNHNGNTCRFKNTVCYVCGQKGHIKGSPFCTGEAQSNRKPGGNSQQPRGGKAGKDRSVNTTEAAINSVRAVHTRAVSKAAPEKELKDGKPSDKSFQQGKDGKPSDPKKKKRKRSKKKVIVTEVDSTGKKVEWNRPTPCMDIAVSGTKGGKRAHIKALPDTGSTQTAISLKFARRLKVQINPHGSIPLCAADGKRMSCEGSARIRIYFEGLEIETEALVSSVVQDEILISWHDLIKLEVIPTNFPHRKKEKAADLVRDTSQQVQADMLRTHHEPEGPIDEFAPGTPVVIQDVDTHRWDVNGIVHDSFQSSRCLKIMVENGMMLFRDREDVRPRPV